MTKFRRFIFRVNQGMIKERMQQGKHSEREIAMKRNMVLFGLIVIVAGIVIYTNINNKLPTETAAKAGYLAPSFELEGLDGQTYSFEPGESGKAMFVNFWYSTCPPCIEEAPELQALYEKYQDKMDIYAVNVLKLDSIEKVEQFVDEYSLEFPVLLDKDSEIVDLYNAYGYPTNFLIDEKGVVQEVLLGLKSPDELEEKIKSIL